MKKLFISICLLCAAAAVSAAGYFAGFENEKGFTPDATEICLNVTRPAPPGAFAEIVLSPAISYGEGKDMLFDGNDRSKYLTTVRPVEMLFRLKQPYAMKDYYMVSANDYPNRDPYSWILEGSEDGSLWERLHSVEGHVFSERFEKAEFTFENSRPCLYYRFRDIATRGSVPDTYLQLAELHLGLPDSLESETEEGMSTRIVPGVPDLWTGRQGDGWSTPGCLEISGTVAAKGRGLCVNTVYKDVDIQVKKNTVFSFCILPMFRGDFDYSHANKYVSLDLRFSDGTLLSETGAEDRDGFPMGARGQGFSKRTFTGQWNYICCDLSAFAGKKIKDILAVYDRPEGGEAGACFAVYADDIRIDERKPAKRETAADFVDTTRGSNDSFVYTRGLHYPACCLPNCFTAWTPSTTAGERRIYAWQPGNKITHFMSGHAVNYCLGDHGNFMVMPNSDIDAELCDPMETDVWKRGSDFDRDTETARAHGYSVTLKRGNIRAEMAPTMRCGAMRFRFGTKAPVNVILDSMNGEVRATGRIEFGPDGSFDAFTDQYSDQGKGMPGLYVHGEFSVKPVLTRRLSEDTPLSIVKFPDGTKEVTLMMGTSYISCAQAKKNLDMEIGGDSFDAVRNKAKAEWNALFDRVKIDRSGPNVTENYLITFYSCMYRLFRFPTTLTENIGAKESPVWVYTSPYASERDRPAVKPGDMRTSNGFWDNYRTTWPAYALLAPDKDTEALNGILMHYKETGWLAKWLCPRGIDCMVGSSSDIVCAEAMVKGIEFDYETAYECALKNATVVPPAGMGRAAMNYYPYRGDTALVGYSWMIEDCVNDYGIAKMAEMLGHEDEAAYFRHTAAFYSKMFNPEIGFFVSKANEGGWARTKDNFDPFLWDDGFAESNAWGASVSAVFDGEGLAALYGGREGLAKRLDDLFAADCHFTRNFVTHENFEARDLRMGQFQHNNQPSQHIPYMYAFTEQKYKTQALTREILRRLYVGADFGQGYTGDEDNGEQSGYFVMASLGFYPLSPASGEYVITSPLFDRVTLDLLSGRLVIEARNNKKENPYIQSLTVDGKPWNKITIDHDTLIKAKRIVFDMGPDPSRWAEGTYPESLTEKGKAPSPLRDIYSDGSFFSDDNSDSWKTAEEPVYQTLDAPEKVVMVTLCCNGKDTAPREFALWGSNGGDDWTLLEERKNITFKWDRQLKPFIVRNPGLYTRYRLDVKGDLAEAELLK
ncbi:MAG: GH92 family glycosyl hydrolase [Abditibacteriota bacterium]|nr:GH92 family glycosyl hydrolase [Abditibacteriota bacterium]